jgi:septation ring formation regulator EzrA
MTDSQKLKQYRELLKVKINKQLFPFNLSAKKDIQHILDKIDSIYDKMVRHVDASREKNSRYSQLSRNDVTSGANDVHIDDPVGDISHIVTVYTADSGGCVSRM